MTEAEWLECTQPAKMLDYVLRKASPRKLRLYAVGCARLLWDDRLDVKSRRALELAERMADRRSTVSGEDIRFAQIFAYPIGIRWTIEPGDAGAAAARWANGIGLQFTPAEETDRTRWVREIFGNPFRPTAFDARWRTPTVCKVGEALYEEADFDRLPILADALEEVGCTHSEVLAHLRDPGPHVRGCWALDGVLGRE